MAGVIVVDANVIIALHDATDPHHNWARGFFASTLDAEWSTSVLTLAEVLVHPVRKNSDRGFLASIAGLGISVIGLDEVDSLELAKVRAESALRMPDAVVLLAAKKADAAIATCDAALTRKSREWGIEVHSPAPGD